MSIYTAHTLIQKPEGLFVIAYLGMEPKMPKLTFDKSVELYNQQLRAWLSTAKPFRVKPEDEKAFKDVLNGPMKLQNVCKSDIDELLHDGYIIESIAHRIAFNATCEIPACTILGC